MHRAGEGRETFAVPKGLGAQADNAKGSAHKKEDEEVCAGTGEGQETFAAPKIRGAQADNANGYGSAHKGECAELCTRTGKGR